MKRLAIPFLALILMGAGCSTTQEPITNSDSDIQKEPITFSGNWIYEGDSQILTLNLNQTDDSIIGWHCLVAGVMLIDCPEEDKGYTILGRIDENGVSLLDIQSVQTLEMGKARIELTDANTLSWELIEQPGGQERFPEKASLKK